MPLSDLPSKNLDMMLKSMTFILIITYKDKTLELPQY